MENEKVGEDDGNGNDDRAHGDGMMIESWVMAMMIELLVKMRKI